MIRAAHTSLLRTSVRLLLSTALVVGVCSPGLAQQGKASAKADPKAAQKAPEAAPAAPGKPVLVAKVGEWGVYVTSGGKDRQCYALSQPSERAPAALKRDPAFLFISSRPTEKVRNEVSIIMGFDVKAADKTPPEAVIGTDKFALAVQGPHLWVRDAAKALPMVDAMRKGAKLTVKAASLRGNVTTDSYPLTGLAGALDRVQKECP